MVGVQKNPDKQKKEGGVAFRAAKPINEKLAAPLTTEEQRKLDVSLLLAAIEKDIDKMKEALDKGADINIKDGNGYTPLIYSAYLGNENIVELLVENGAMINERDALDKTALTHAAYRGHLRTVSHLLEKGAKANVHDYFGKTPLDYAERGGHKEIAGLLKKAAG